MSNEDLHVASAAYVAIHILLKRKRQRKKRRWWMRRCLERRDYGGENLLGLQMEDSAGFRSCTRMSASDFEELLCLVGPRIATIDASFRKAIPEDVQLAVTLRFLALGDSYSSLMHLFKISKQSISSIIPDVCECIVEVLDKYLKVPSSTEEWLQIAHAYSSSWNYPHCVGSVGGRHVLLQSNHENAPSSVLFAIVDANYNFIYANCETQGMGCDGDMFKSTEFYRKLSRNELNFPTLTPLPGRKLPVPHVLIADDTFPLDEYIMQPYPGVHKKNSAEDVFNFRLSRANLVLENVLGLISTGFKIFREPLPFTAKKAEFIILTCVYLHNFLRRNVLAESKYTPPGTFDFEDIEANVVIEGSWRQDINEARGIQNLPSVDCKSHASAANLQNEFRDYFVSPVGRIPGQNFFM